MIKLIQGDALEILPTLVDERFDLVISDPPAEMSFEDTVKSLWLAYDAASEDAALFLFGVTAGKLIQLANKSGWNVVGLVSISGAKGQIVIATKPFPNTNRDWFESLPYSIAVRGSKGSAQHPTTKPREWFKWIFEGQEWHKVLDVFAGLAPVGHICKDRGIQYVGIELDPEAVHYSRLT